VLHATLRLVIGLIVLIVVAFIVSADSRLILAETFDNLAWIVARRAQKCHSARLNFVLRECSDEFVRIIL